jgi:uncharacterized membrane protein
MAQQYKKNSNKARHITFSVAFAMIKKAISTPSPNGQKRTYDMSYDSRPIYLLTLLAVPLAFCAMILARIVSFPLGLGILLLAGVFQTMGLLFSIRSSFVRHKNSRQG